MTINEKLSSALARIAQNDNSALEIIYDECSKSIYFFALSYLKNVCLAENILQDTFVVILEKAHLYRHSKNARAWILQITKNLCLNYLKRSKYESEFASKSLTSSPDFQECLENSLELTCILKNLSEEERNILILKLEYGFTYKELSGLTGKSQRTLKRKMETIIAKCEMLCTFYQN